jgi:hypothetical protein
MMPRGIGNNRLGGSYDAGAQQDIADGDSFELQPTFLTGSADAINPHIAGNYIIDTAGVDAITLAAPTDGVDDGLSISIYSDSTNAHTVTCPTTLFCPGTAKKTIATFAAFQGAGIGLRAMDGNWHVVAQTGITFS